MSKLTFIIPTVGRKTLSNTIKCLENQKNQNWNAIIVFDGIKPNIKTVNPKIRIIQTKKLGTNINSAGNVRNVGIKHAKTEWVAFVDDDDILTKNYVQTFYNEIDEFKDIDVIIFRMHNKDNRILPEIKTDNFYKNRVGISFAVKSNIVKKNVKFVPSRTEDYDMLNKLRAKSYKIMISPYIRYLVRNQFKNVIDHNNVIGNRIFINK
jgi:glycosyltransferase involved in cell wall biosynthesis